MHHKLKIYWRKLLASGKCLWAKWAESLAHVAHFDTAHTNNWRGGEGRRSLNSGRLCKGSFIIARRNTEARNTRYRGRGGALTSREFLDSCWGAHLIECSAICWITPCV